MKTRGGEVRRNANESEGEGGKVPRGGESSLVEVGQTNYSQPPTSTIALRNGIVNRNYPSGASIEKARKSPHP